MKLVFDIGSHSGEDFRHFRSRGFRVVGVDADLSSVGKLSQEFSQDPFAVCLCAAISDSGGIREFHYSPHHPDWSSLSRSIAGRDASQVFDIPVPALTLDQLIGHFGVPHYLKLDIEGGEMDALRGLSLAVPEYLSMEFDHLGLSVEDLLHRLKVLGYHSYAWRDQEDNLTRGYGEALAWSPMEMPTPVTSAWCDLFASIHPPHTAGCWGAMPDQGVSQKDPGPARESTTLIAIRSNLRNTAAREAILETWGAQCSSACIPAFYTGRPGSEAEQEGIFQGSASPFLKSSLLRWEFDQVLFIDDDTFLNPGGISQLLPHIAEAQILECGSLTGRSDGFLMTRHMAELLARQPDAPGRDMPLLTQVSLLGGISPGLTSLLTPEAPHFPLPAEFPLITRPCTPGVMVVIHALRTLQPAFEVKVSHEHWQDTVLFYENGAFCRQGITDCGIWEPLEENQGLLLKWFKWGSERLVPPDGVAPGKSEEFEQKFTKDTEPADSVANLDRSA